MVGGSPPLAAAADAAVEGERGRRGLGQERRPSRCISDIYFVIITGVNFGPLFDCFYHFATGLCWVGLWWAYGAKFDPLRIPSFETALAVRRSKLITVL